MTVKKTNVFYSIGSEEAWLNKQGEQGLLLVGSHPGIYIFKKTDNRYTYTIEWLNSSVETEENQKYIASRVGNGTEYCISKNCYAYFASKDGSAFKRSDVSMEKAGKRYLTNAMFCVVLAVFIAGLIVYNISWMNKFDKMEYTNKEGKETTGYVVPYDSKEIILFKDAVVGQNPARLFLKLLIPIAGVVCISLIYTWSAYIGWLTYPDCREYRQSRRSLKEAKK